MIMSKNEDYILNLRNYVSRIVGNVISIDELPTKELKKLPFVITEAFHLFTGVLFDILVVFAIEKLKEGRAYSWTN